MSFLMVRFQFFHSLHCFLLIEVFSFSFLDGDSSSWAEAKTRTKTVTVDFRNEMGFAIDYPDGVFNTCGGAQTASIAFFFIDSDYFPSHHFSFLSFIN
jgi:hypothetical protein